MTAVAEVQAALRAARAPEVDEIRGRLARHQIVGVIGEAEVGKTTTMQQALPADGMIRVDLDGAASDGQLAYLILRGIVRGLLGPVDFSLLAGDAVVPVRILDRRPEVAEVVGFDGLEEALRPAPSGTVDLPEALLALRRVVRTSPVTVWVDHAESPTLTPRHPVDVSRLLWGLRELAQRFTDLQLVVTAREAFRDELLGPREPLHQQGSWLTLDVPSHATWVDVAKAVDRSELEALRLASLLHGHPVSMQLALLVEPVRREAADAIVARLAARDDGLAGRSMQHARTLHRLGGQVLGQIARGEPPYGRQQRGPASPQEIRKVLNRLWLAGLLRRDPSGWTVANPIVAMRLRGLAQRPAIVPDESA